MRLAGEYRCLSRPSSAVEPSHPPNSVDLLHMTLLEKGSIQKRDVSQRFLIDLFFAKRSHTRLHHEFQPTGPGLVRAVLEQLSSNWI